MTDKTENTSGQCSAYVPGPALCTNGFPQNGACRGSACHCCGNPTDKLPACMREDLGKPWINDNGLPTFGPAAKKD